MKKLTSIIVAIMVITLAGCNNGKEENLQPGQRAFPEFHYALDSIFKTKDGHIKGLSLGGDAFEIKTHEWGRAIEEDTSFISFEKKIDSSTTYTITYFIQKKAIEEIELQVISKNLDEGSKIFEDIKDYFKDKYKQEGQEKGITVYIDKTDEKNPSKITIADNSTPTESSISILFYKEK